MTFRVVWEPVAVNLATRLRIGRYRVVYEIDQAARSVKIRHMGRRT